MARYQKVIINSKVVVKFYVTISRSAKPNFDDDTEFMFHTVTHFRCIFYEHVEVRMTFQTLQANYINMEA